MAGKLAAAARGPGTRSLSPRRPALHRLHFPAAAAASAKRSHKGSEWPVSGRAGLGGAVGWSAAFLHYGGHPIPVARPSGRIITPLMLAPSPSFAYISRAR